MRYSTGSIQCTCDPSSETDAIVRRFLSLQPYSQSGGLYRKNRKLALYRELLQEPGAYAVSVLVRESIQTGMTLYWSAP